jgi:peptidoglycan/LPS O-acetylase OafA/YrhL
MILGAVFGILIKSRHRLIHFISSSKAQLFIWIVFIGVMLGFIKLYSPLQQIIVSALACGIINSQITERTFLINLDKRIFNFLGKISYGIYIIHPMVLFGISLLVKHRQFSFYSKYIIVYVGGFGVTILLAYLSYEYFEKRILQLKRKYTIVKSSGVALN